MDVTELSPLFSSSPGPNDYGTVDRLLVFSGSTDSIMVDVPIVDDDLTEDDLSPSDLVTIAPATTTIRINDNDSKSHLIILCPSLDHSQPTHTPAKMLQLVSNMKPISSQSINKVLSR